MFMYGNMGFKPWFTESNAGLSSVFGKHWVNISSKIIEAKLHV